MATGFTRQPRADRLGYVAMNVTDLERSVDFWTTVVQLDVSDGTDDRVYLRGAMQHHWIVLHRADRPGLARLGVEVFDRAELDAIEQILRGRGIVVESGNGLATDHVDRYVRFDDPAGNHIELYHDMVTMPVPPRPTNVVINEIQHVVLGENELAEAEEFYTEVLGMRLSDRLGPGTAFMHFRNGWHHGIGLGSGRGPGLHHVCFEPPDLDTTMRARARVMKAQVPITADLLKHGPSGSVGFYCQGPDTIVEFSFGARRFAEDEVYKPRLLPMARGGVDVYQAGLADADFGAVARLQREAQEAAAPAG